MPSAHHSRRGKAARWPAHRVVPGGTPAPDVRPRAAHREANLPDGKARLPRHDRAASPGPPGEPMRGADSPDAHTRTGAARQRQGFPARKVEHTRDHSRWDGPMPVERILRRWCWSGRPDSFDSCLVASPLAPASNAQFNPTPSCRRLQKWTERLGDAVTNWNPDFLKMGMRYCCFAA